MINLSESERSLTPSVLLKEKMVKLIGQNGPMTFSDFTALMNEGRRVGLKVEDFLDQSDYFTKLGLPELIDQESKTIPSDPKERQSKLWLLRQARGLLKLKGLKVLIQEKE